MWTPAAKPRSVLAVTGGTGRVASSTDILDYCENTLYQVAADPWNLLGALPITALRRRDRGGTTITTIWHTLAPERTNDRREELAGTRPLSFEKAVLAELSVLYRVARRLGARPEEAEDLVQAAVFKAFRNWHQFDGRYMRSWLVRILRNERLAQMRVFRPHHDPEELTDDLVVEEGFWSTVESRIEAERIIREMDNLSEPYRLAVQLCDVEQMSYEEAAEAMDVPVGTVRSRLFRARVELRKRLGDGA